MIILYPLHSYITWTLKCLGYGFWHYFQQYFRHRGDQFYWWRKPEYLDKTPNARDIIRYWTLDDVTFHNLLILVNDGWELYEWKDNMCTIICYISRHCHQFGMNSFFFWLFRQYKFFFVFMPQHILAIRMGRVSVIAGDIQQYDKSERRKEI
jgi:hypothetical protein